MKKILRVLGGSLFIGLLLLTALAPTAGAHTSHASATTHPSLLPKSPLSGGVLMAQAIHKGIIHPHQGARQSTTSPQLSCTPTPCALPNVQASEGGNPVNEDPIVVNLNNTKQLLTGGNDYNCASLQGFFTSGNGGTSWTHTCMNVLAGDQGDGDPAVGYDLNNTAYIAGIDAVGSSSSVIAFEKSTNNGVSWSSPAVAVNPTFPGGFADKEWLQIDTTPTSPHANAIYISTTQFATNNNSEISVTHSTNGGSTWTTKVVDTQQVFPAIDQFSDLAVGKDGTVYVSWMRCTANGPTGDCGGTTATFWFSKSTDGGNTWSTAKKIGSAVLAPDTCSAFYGCLPNTPERVSDIPAIDVDNSSGANAGHLYVVNYTWTGTFMKVQVTRSTNGGSTWGTPKRVTPTSDTHDQFFPWLTVSKTGVVGVTWLDRRNDPANINYEAFSSISTNGGTSYNTNVQIATVASNPLNDGFNGDFMGDYTGNYWAGKNLYASWMDSRNGSDCQDEVGGYKSSV